MSSHGRTIELIRPGAFGDLLMLTALFPALKRQGYRIRVVCWPHFGAILADHPEVDEFVFFPAGQSLYHDDVQRYIASVAPPADKTVSLEYPNWQGPGLARHALQQHITTVFCEQAGVPPSTALSIGLTPEQLAWGARFRDDILIQTSTAYSPYKNWPPDRWEELAHRIRSELGCEVRQIGATDDPRIPGVERVDSPDIRHAIAALKACRVFVGLDSVFNHAAQAVGKRSIILWGSTNPTAFGYAQNINLVNGVAWQPAMGNEAPLLRCQPCYREYKHLHQHPGLRCLYTVPHPQAVLPEPHDPGQPQLHACMAANTVPVVLHYVQALLDQPENAP
jgi:hypothetical protein